MPKFRKKKRKVRGVLILILLLFLILVYVFLFSPLFKIKTIEVSGNKEIKTEMIKESFNYGNIFLLTNNKIKDNLLNNFPKILELNIEKNLLKGIVKLTIKERQRFGIICQISEQETRDKKQEIIKGCFYIDKEGFTFEDAPETSGSLILLIKDYSQRDFNLGDQILEGEVVSFCSQVKEALSLETDIRVSDFIIQSFPCKDLKAITSEGWYIVFDPQRDAGGQILTLRAILGESIDQEERKELEYIDLRIENRAYYK